MPPRPFHYALRAGTDICHVSRIRQVLARTDDPLSRLHKFTSKILTAPERAYFWHRFGPPASISADLHGVSQYLAGRFAAKEAIRKACEQFDHSARGFQSIIILPITYTPHAKHQSVRPQGLVLDAPYVSTPGKEGQKAYAEKAFPAYKLDDLEGQLCEVSISHDGMWATAVALVPTMAAQLHVDGSKPPQG
ncbi:hypothetical protein ACEQ8H_002705 [Pleosporales sp. CAS-2024a]